MCSCGILVYAKTNCDVEMNWTLVATWIVGQLEGPSFMKLTVLCSYMFCILFCNLSSRLKAEQGIELISKMDAHYRVLPMLSVCHRNHSDLCRFTGTRGPKRVAMFPVGICLIPATLTILDVQISSSMLHPIRRLYWSGSFNV